MSHADFIHLRVHTAYSLSEGALKVKELVKLCGKHAMPAVAITDTSNLFGALDFSGACADEGIQPIIGCQLAIRREDADPRLGRVPEPDPLVLLCQSNKGYENLLKLVSKAFLETEGGETPQIALADLEAHAEGLLLLTGGPAGPVGRLLLDEKREAAEVLLRRLVAAFPGRTYVEIMRHGMPAEEKSEEAFIDLAYALDLPLLATNECFFSDEGMYEAHDALLCIAEGTYVSQADRRHLTKEHRFKSAGEMRKLFADLPEAIDNTLVVAKRCSAMAEKRKPILPPYPQLKGRTEAEALRDLSREGLEKRLERQIFTAEMDPHERERIAKPYRERLDYELEVIEKMGFPGYFLIVADFIQWTKNQDIPVGPGRGSGAGSVVAWALTITDLDPLRFGLLFERFLNPERVSMPDFDIDFCQDRRDEVLRYVQAAYGRDKVAQIITFGKLQARAVLRDVGRVLEMPYGQVDRICKMVPNNPAKPVTLPEAIDSESQLRQMRDSDENVRHLLDIGIKLEGLYRHASTHAAGVVIGDRPLDELVPLYRDPRSDMPVTQFSMKWVEAAGLVKFDFLGLKTLSVLATAVRLTGRQDLDLSTIPLDDKPSFDLLGKAEAVGVFQLESTGMRDVLRKMRPDTLEDIIAVVALYRPGPMANIPKYIACKHGDEKPDYLHPTLEPILKETFGIMVYQEQVMQIAQVLSGYSLGGADLLRRAMGKKNKEEMDAQRKTFVDGAVARGVDGEKASHIFDQVARFAEYGFNKSHAAAYALVAYQTAYMKANFPVEFIAASMSYDLNNTDKLNVFKGDLERMKFKLLPPDINKSGVFFTVENGVVRYALSAIKNVGEAAMKALFEERERNGPFKNLFDFAKRLDTKTVNRRQLENMVRAGVFDSLDPNRAKLFEGIDVLIRHAQAATEERESNQTSLFGGGGGIKETSALKLAERPDWPHWERLKEENAAIGYYLSAHPMDAYTVSLQRLEVIRSDRIGARLASGLSGRVRLAGNVISKQERTSSRGSRFAFLNCSDAGGSFEVTLFSEVLAVARDLIESGKPLLISADAKLDGEQLRLTAQSVESLDEAAARTAAGLKIFLRDTSPLLAIRQLLAGEKKGRGHIFLIAQCPENEVEIKLKESYSLSPQALAAVKNIPGITEVREV